MVALGKVTVFILRKFPAKDGHEPELLLFRHPYAGNQIPAGTVELNETPEKAALREGHEETGLPDLRIVKKLGVEMETLPPDVRVVSQPISVYARPDIGSFHWAQIPRGIQVTVGKQIGDFIQVSYFEWDVEPEKNAITYQISGWAKTSGLTTRRKRHFFLLTTNAETAPFWNVAIDHHIFRLFWAPLKNLPPIIPPQDRWLRYLEGIDLE